MRIFISHASANKEVVKKFADLLENLSTDISVFCSSQEGSIRVGKNFIETILGELDKSDLFIPVISKEYYESHFAMVELGTACAFLFQKYKKRGEAYIYPFAIYPIKKGYALAGTPIANLQAGEINNREDIRSFFNDLVENNGIAKSPNINANISSFVFQVDQILLKDFDLLNEARVGAYFDESIFFRRKKDIASCSIAKDGITLNFNMNPYEIQDAKRPFFVSLALRYVDTFDLGRYLDFNMQSTFHFVLTSFTNSLKRITIEFKHNGTDILDSFVKEVCYGENNISLPLSVMKSNALNRISEICFVIHPEDVTEAEGMFKISDVHVEFN
ncbi:MAG: toll/interleukin-1 receptor domain-containing protein [Oscillospiraceae bacterium]|nr:toll/interleukin-1 receptor domain-containing protein [Oscillospiraceae bacterium]